MVPIEIFVLDAVTELPIGEANITYCISANQQEEIRFGATDMNGKCIRSLRSGEYNFKVNKAGYYEMQSIVNTETNGSEVAFKLIFQ